MTSKISCCKMIKNAVKRRLWYGAVLFLGFFVMLPLSAMLRLESKSRIETVYAMEDPQTLARHLKAVQAQFLRFVGGGDYLVMMAVLGAALLGAWCGLYWLHSRKKMDLTGSLPVRREKIFLSESLATLILFLVPYFVNVVLELLVGAAKGIMTKEVFPMVFAGIGLNLFYFIVLYFCAAAAMLLTGKILTGILGTLVFLVIGPATYGILLAMPSAFWKTYVNMSETGRVAVAYLSPAGSFMVAVSRMEHWITWEGQNLNLVPSLISGLIMCLIFGGLSVWLMKIRPAEGAENSMAFPATEGVIKALILYPLSLGGGIFFMALGTSRYDLGEKPWFWFGLFFTLIVGSILIEVIYHFDRKMIFGHQMWTGISMAAVVITAAVFSFDMVGYDHWLPDSEEVAGMALCADPYYCEYPDGSATSLEYLKNHLDELNGEGILELAREGVNNLEEETSVDEDRRNVTVLFKMKNGSVKARDYSVSRESTAKVLEHLFQQRIYREVQFPYILEKEDDVRLGDLWRIGQSSSLEGLTNKEKKEFAAIYREELESLDYNELFAPGSGEINVSSLGTYPLNDNFVKSMAYLQEKGIGAAMSWDDTEIVSMEFYFAGDEEELHAEREVWSSEDTVSAQTDEVKKITDPEQIAEARKNLICDEQYWQEGAWETEDGLRVGVTYRGKDEDVYVDCAYLKGEVPEIVKELKGKE